VKKKYIKEEKGGGIRNQDTSYILLHDPRTHPQELEKKNTLKANTTYTADFQEYYRI